MTTALRPMTTGEILDRTFNLYRNNFILFAGIAVLPPALKLILDLVQLQANVAGLSRTMGGSIVASSGSLDSAPLGGGTFLLTLVYLFGLIVATGATVYAVSMVYLGKDTTIGGSYKGIGAHVLRLIGIFLLMVIIFIGLGILVIGVPFFIAVNARSLALLIASMILGSVVLLHLYVCLSVASSACVVEKTGVISSFNRSMKLTKGARGKIWLVLLLGFVLNLALTVALIALVGIIVRTTLSALLATLTFVLGQFIVGTLVTPIFTVALVLIYYDQRVRKEAFDLQLMMESLGVTAPQAQVTAATPIG